MKNQRFAATVRDLTSRGQGVLTHPDGRVYFASAVWVGEQGIFEIIGQQGRSGQARLIELTLASPQRQTPDCPHQGFDAHSCGGCPWMFMSYPEQLRVKQQRVERLLDKLGCASLLPPILGSAQSLGYRNRAQLKSDGKVLGYVASAAHRIAPIDDCLILSEHNRATLQQLREQLPQASWRPARGKPWSNLEIDDQIVAGDVLPNAKRPFMQGNTAQNQRMRAWLAATLAAIEDKTVLVELFAGSGNFTEVALQSGCESIVAVDSFAPAIDALRARDLANLHAKCLNLHRDSVDPVLADLLKGADVLLLDPPRDGLKALGRYLDAGEKLRWLIYISCDLATYARDIQSAMDRGFAMHRVQALDLFPQTPHVELLSVLRKLD